MTTADLAITSSGRTVYELTALRVPAIVIASNSREATHSFANQTGMIYLDLHNQLSNSTIQNTIIQMLEEPSFRKQIKSKLSHYNLRKGKKRVLDQINSYLSEQSSTSFVN